MNDWMKKGLLPKIYSPISFALLASLLTLATLAQANSFEGWYQIDVILFKPNQTITDTETWSEFVPSYPHSTIAVTEPRVSNLSQLRHFEAQKKFGIKESVEPSFGPNNFLFEDEGNSTRNQLILDALTKSDEKGSKKTMKIKGPATRNSNQLSTQTESEAFNETFQLPPQNPNSAGNRAFKSTLEDSTLKGILRRLNRSSRFSVLSHQSWLQPIQDDPSFILFQAGQRYNDRHEIEGTLGFSRGRYLHVQSDLWYSNFKPRTDINAGGFNRPKSANIDLPEEMLLDYQDLIKLEENRGLFYLHETYRMVQSRRMRSNELHYLDHPLFGVIVRINRYLFRTTEDD